MEHLLTAAGAYHRSLLDIAVLLHNIENPAQHRLWEVLFDYYNFVLR